MRQVPTFLPPDPAMDGATAIEPFRWIRLPNETAQVVTVDFTRKKIEAALDEPDLNHLLGDDRLDKAVSDISAEEVQNLIVSFYLGLTDLSGFNKSQLEVLVERVKASALYVSSVEAKMAYMKGLFGNDPDWRLPPQQDNYAIFSFSFFDEYVLGRVETRIKALDLKKNTQRVRNRLYQWLVVK